MDPDVRLRLERLVARIDPAGNGTPPEPPTPEDEPALVTRALDPARPAAERVEALARLIDLHPVDRGASPVLQALLASDDLGVQLGAIDLVQPFDGAAMDRLLALLDHASADVRYAAARALGRRKDRSIGARLVPWLRGDDPEARRVAVEVMTWVLDDREGARVLSALWDLPQLGPAERLRLAARLAVLGDDRVADWLIAAFEAGGDLAAPARRALESLLEARDHLSETTDEGRSPLPPEKTGNSG